MIAAAIAGLALPIGSHACAQPATEPSAPEAIIEPAIEPAMDPSGALPAEDAVDADDLRRANAQAADEVLGIVLEKLASDDYATREAATLRLENDPRITLDAIERRLADSSLTPEQRVRLDRAARARFSSNPRAGLGVQFGAPRREEVRAAPQAAPAAPPARARV